LSTLDKLAAAASRVTRPWVVEMGVVEDAILAP
jgi:hypothetical protein